MSDAVPPGWFPDYADPSRLRYWDGADWTAYTAPAPQPESWSQPVEVELSGERRRVYGNDMLYVSTGSGTKVGRINLATGKITMDLPDWREHFDAFVEQWRATHGMAVDAVPASTAGEPLPQHVDEAQADAIWTDLAQNRAGAAARQKATELRADAPVRTFVARVFGAHTDERAFRVGANGEEEVGYQLSKLDDPWRVIHAVPIGENDSDIDHVVIGPAGVFTLNTKHHPGGKVWVGGNTVMVNGQRYPYVRNSRFEASRAATRLSAACGFSVHVEPIIVVLAGDLRIKTQPDGVHVVGRRRIAKWLRQRPSVHDSSTVAAVYEYARRDTTWITPR